VSRAERRREEIVAEISRLPLAVPGSLTDRMTRCQRAGCHCKADPPRLHGPYPTWTRRVDGTTITRTLRPEEADQLRTGLNAHRRLRQLITELDAISARIAEESLASQR
jgi:hypothetical protein